MHVARRYGSRAWRRQSRSLFCRESAGTSGSLRSPMSPTQWPAAAWRVLVSQRCPSSKQSSGKEDLKKRFIILITIISNSKTPAFCVHATELHSCTHQYAICIFIQGVIFVTMSDMQNQFTSSFGVLLSMLGSVVGTGNIWRFPRIVANHATEGGLHRTS